MTVPFQPDDFDAVGFTKAALSKGYSLDKIAGILEQRGHGQYAKELRSSQADNASNFGLQAAEGTMYGIGRPMAAAGGALVQKLTGDGRPLVDIYKQLRDDANIKSNAYASQNPGKAMSAQVLGGVVAGRLNPTQLAAFGNATVAGRAGNAAINAGAAGVANSVLNTEQDLTTWDGLKNAGLDAGIMGGFSALAGGALTPVAEGVGTLVRAGGNALPDALKRRAMNLAKPVSAARTAAATAVEPTATNLPATAPRPMLDRMRAAAAKAIAPGPRVNPAGGEARQMSRMQAQGLTWDELDNRIAQADPTDIFAEVVGEKGVRDLTTQRILGNKAPDQIAKTMRSRAQSETPNLITKAEAELGPQVDDIAYANERLATARANAKQPYEQFESYGFLRTKPVKEALVNLNRTIRTLKLGTGVFDEMAAVAQLEGDKLPKNLFDPQTGLLKKALTARQINHLKQALDQIIYASEPAVINGVKQPTRFSDTQRELLKRARNTLVDAADKATEYVDDAGQRVSAFKTARDTWAGPVTERNAFQEGQKVASRTIQPVDVPRILDTPQKAAVARGASNQVLDELNKVRNAASGGVIADPSRVLTGSPVANARTLVAAGGDAAKAQRLTQAAEKAANRLGTYRRVMGGSPTAERVGDMGEQIAGPVNPFEVAGAISNPTGAAAGLWQKFATPIGRRLLGDQLDEAARYSLAGADGEMTLQEARDAIKRMEPFLLDYWRKQMVTGSRLGNQAAREFTGRR